MNQTYENYKGAIHFSILALVLILVLAKLFTSQEVVYSGSRGLTATAGGSSTENKAEIKTVFSLPFGLGKKKATTTTTQNVVAPPAKKTGE